MKRIAIIIILTSNKNILQIKYNVGMVKTGTEQGRDEVRIP